MAMNQLRIFESIPFALIVLCLLPGTTGVLNSDEQALLDFAAAVRHGPKLNWNSNTPICSSWIGVICSADQNRVRALRLPGIGLYGQIPANTLGKLDALRALSLRSNRLSGDLPADVSSLPSLHYLSLQNNNFSGDLPSSFSSSLVVLDLSQNSFTGKIPLAVGNMTQLSVLNLQDNSLSGPIPEIKFLKLKHVNLSFNNLSGSIPSSFQNFPNDSFLGNPLLCGLPLEQCYAGVPSPSPLIPPFLSPPELSPQKKKPSGTRLGSWAIVAIAAGGLALLLLLIMLMMVCILKKKDRKGRRALKEKGLSAGKSEKPKESSSSGVQPAEKNKLSFFEGCAYNFDLEDLLRASAEILGKGSYGTAYKAVLEDGTAVVVKRLKEVVVGKREFEQQMEIIGRIGRHQNVLPLRAYYYSKDEKLLVSDFVPNGSFSTLLHGKRGAGRTPVDWDSRVKIALGAAQGIAQIHAEGGGKFIHGNIKSSNILLNQDLDALITDFGLTTLMNVPVARSRIVVGYRAPEVIATKKVSQKSDVYSFGVILLEMLTGKPPFQSQGQDDVVDLPRWVQSVVREEWTAEVFDTELMKYPNTEDHLVQMLQIAMACVAKAPYERPDIQEVIQTIEEIRNSKSGNQASSQLP